MGNYTVQLNTISTICNVMVNNMDIINNYPLSSGTGSAGATVTAFLENGENTLGVYAASIDVDNHIEELRERAHCSVFLNVNSPDRKVEVTSIKVAPDEKMLTTSKHSNYSYPTLRTGAIKELGYLNDDSYLRVMERPFMLKDVPKWRWVDAKPIPKERDNIKKLKEAYQRIWDVMNSGDFEKLRNITALAMREYGEAEGLSGDFFLASAGFEEDFKDPEFKMRPLDFSKYEYQTFRGGRLVRFADGNGDPPLEYTVSNDGEFSYNPYLSMLEEGMMITR